MSNETLSSRERVARILRRQPTDRFAIDFGSHFSSGISAFAYPALRRYLGLPEKETVICDVIQFLARVDEDVLQRFHVDVLMLHPGWPRTYRWRPRPGFAFEMPTTAPALIEPDGSWTIQRGESRLRMPPDGFFFDGGWPGFFDEEPVEALVQEARRVYEETDYAAFYTQFNGYFSEDSEWLCTMLTDPESLIDANRVNCASDLERAGRLIDLIGGYVQGIWVVSDLGMQSGPLCRPSLYEQISAPFLRRLCSFIHANSDWKVMLHCCGAIRPFLPLLIDCGIDGLNPVQISAVDMEARGLKAQFGDQLVFWGGGCDTQRVLGLKTAAEVASNVRDLVGIFKQNGGYVFSQVHNIMGDVTPDNIVTMFDTAYEMS